MSRRRRRGTNIVMQQFEENAFISEEPTNEEVVVEVSVDEAPVTVTEEYIDVAMLNTDVYRGSYFLMYCIDTKEARFVPVTSVKYTVKAQKLLKSVFDNAEAPYDWSEELISLLVPFEDIRLALWKTGLVEKENIDFKEIIARLLRTGKLPLKE